MGKYWNPNDSNDLNNKVVESINDYREFALQNEGQDISDSIFDKVTGSYKKGNSIGSDIWTSQELYKLEPVSKSEIVDALRIAKSTVAVPHQNLINLSPELGKVKGTRTINKTPMTYRMVMRADEEIRKWEIANKAPYDTAGIGSSALLAALKRNLKAEIAFWLDRVFLGVFNDYEKFFDSISIDLLLEECVRTSFPPVIMAFLVQQHVAPRVIQASGFSSEGIQVFKSIIAGCKSSVALTRVYLKLSLIHI